MGAATSKMADKHGDSLDWYLVEAPLEELEKAFGVTKASFGMVLPEQWHSTHEKAMRLIDATDVDTIIEQHMKDNLLPLVARADRGQLHALLQGGRRRQGGQAHQQGRL